MNTESQPRSGLAAEPRCYRRCSLKPPACIPHYNVSVDYKSQYTFLFSSDGYNNAANSIAMPLKPIAAPTQVGNAL